DRGRRPGRNPLHRARDLPRRGDHRHDAGARDVAGADIAGARLGAGRGRRRIQRERVGPAEDAGGHRRPPGVLRAGRRRWSQGRHGHRQRRRTPRPQPGGALPDGRSFRHVSDRGLDGDHLQRGGAARRRGRAGDRRARKACRSGAARRRPARPGEAGRPDRRGMEGRRPPPLTSGGTPDGSRTLDLETIEAERQRIRQTYLRPADARPPTSARGVHHLALLSSDVERTVRFYQDVLGFPLTDIFENRDYRGSNHFFFDIGNGNVLAFFDFPGLGLGPYAEVLGGLHHISTSVEPKTWDRLRARLEEEGIEYLLESGSSIYFLDPDGARLELISDPLGEMYGHEVL